MIFGMVSFLGVPLGVLPGKPKHGCELSQRYRASNVPQTIQNLDYKTITFYTLACVHGVIPLLLVWRGCRVAEPVGLWSLKLHEQDID